MTSSAEKTVLVIDDELAILEMRRIMFQTLGYGVLTADSGEKGLQILCSNRVHVVILDYLMPGMDGEETARRIRKIQPDLPIILSSGCLDIPARVLNLVSVWLSKAEHPEALVDAVRQQIEALPVRRAMAGNRVAP